MAKDLDEEGSARDLMRQQGFETKTEGKALRVVSSEPRPSKASLRAQVEQAMQSGVEVKVLRPQTRRDSGPR